MPGFARTVCTTPLAGLPGGPPSRYGWADNEGLSVNLGGDMTGCQEINCRNDAFKRRLCEAHWELDMIKRKRARALRDKEYRRSAPFELTAWCDRQRYIVEAVMDRVKRDSTDLEAFAELARLVKDMDGALGKMARHLHDESGYSWTDFADALGVSRQAARQRWAGADNRGN